MASKPRTHILLIALGVVSVIVLGYFVWLFLSPGTAIAPVKETVTTDVQSGFINTPSFRELRPFANLPIKAVNVGRADPFAPFLIVNTNVNANENINAPENVNVQ